MDFCYIANHWPIKKECFPYLFIIKLIICEKMYLMSMAEESIYLKKPKKNKTVSSCSPGLFGTWLLETHQLTACYCLSQKDPYKNCSFYVSCIDDNARLKTSDIKVCPFCLLLIKKRN